MVNSWKFVLKIKEIQISNEQRKADIAADFFVLCVETRFVSIQG